MPSRGPKGGLSKQGSSRNNCSLLDGFQGVISHQSKSHEPPSRLHVCSHPSECRARIPFHDKRVLLTPIPIKRTG